MAEIFQPIRGLEKTINQIPNHEGFVYFAYDSGNIYLDKNNQRYLMGGSSSTGFYWANGNDEQISKVYEDNDEDQTYTFSVNILNNPVVPQQDSLIVNSDGRFFRVISVNTTTSIITALLIAVSGSGEGGGGTSTVDLDLSWTGIDLLGSTFIYGKESNIVFTPSSTADEVCEIKVSVTNQDGQTVFERSSRVRNNQKYVVNAGEFPVSNNLTMTVLVTSDHSVYNRGNGLTKTFKPIRVLEMYLEKPADAGMIGIQTSSAQLSYNPYFTGLWTYQHPVQIYYTVDGGEGILSKSLAEGNDKNKQYIDIPHQSHGMHVIGLYLSVNINNKDYTSESIYYEVPFVDSNNEDPIIWTQEDLGTIVQYEPAVVKYMVYSSVAASTGSSIEVQFLQDGVLFDTAEITYGTRWYTLDLTSKYTLGENHFSIVSGGTRKDIDFYITGEGARDLDLVHEDELEMKFDSIGRSNKQIKANRINFTSSVPPKSASALYKAELNGFNWYNNGWADDNDGNGSYLSVCNGASVKIPMANVPINAEGKPWTFEIRFRIRNAKKFATLVTEIPIYQWIKEDGTVSRTGEELTLDEISARGGTPLRDSDGNLVMNEANTTRKEVRTDKYIAFKFLNDDNYGFAIGTQEAYFNARGKVVNVKYREGEIINISFVENKAKNQLSIYLNGILSGVGNLSGTSAFSAGKFFEINSEYCDFDLYKFRVYPIALTMPEIIHNYLSDMKNIDLYDENQLADINDATKLSYSKLLEYNDSHKESPTMPYVVIDMTGETSSGSTELPFAKTASGIDGTRIEFTNPTADILLENEEITPWQYYTHCPSYTADNVNINVQGTSSQIYPRRNFKTKFKKSKNWIYTAGPLAGKAVNKDYYFNTDGTFAPSVQEQVDEIQAGVDDKTIDKATGKAQIKALTTGLQKLSKNWHEDSEPFGSNKFTWKIDYMESSGTYNTGFANLLGNKVYTQNKAGGTQVHHPLDDLGFDGSEYRTSVYGFPMLAFHKTAENTYTYIGRYNCNLDKSANERYGFELEEEHPYVTKEVDNGDGTTSIVHPLVADVAECWELRDNQGLWCSFRYPQDARTLKFNTPRSETNSGVEVAWHFEARYHAFGDQFEYAQNIILDKENNDDYSEDIGGTDKETANAYVLDKMKNLKVLFDWLDSTDPLNPSNQPLSEVVGTETVRLKVNRQLSEDEASEQGVTYELDDSSSPAIRYGIFTKDSLEYRKQKFYAEFSEHLDLHYCSIYFVMTELLLCYDSRGKNMMIATFGPHKAGGDYIWYPIFYDIDTQLGLNNVGAQLWGYDEDCTENNTFSTAQSVLWMNFYDMFKENIKTTYRSLRGGGEDGILSYKNIEGAYICDPEVFKSSYAMRGRRPIIAMGLDEYYKYVLPISEPWRNQEGNMTTANYLYACQGDRKLSRELLINNRLLYMDSKWQAGAFTISTGGMAGIMFRSTGNKRNTTSDKYLDVTDSTGLVPFESTITRTIKDSETGIETEYEFIYAPYKTGVAKYYDADPEYKITPYLNFYLTTFVDEGAFQNTSAYNEEAYPDGMPVYVNPSVKEGYKLGNVDQQLNYFAGSSYITSIGDISTKYVNQVSIPNTPRLVDIRLGSDAPDYFYNDKLDPFNLCTSVNDETGLPDKDSDKSLLTKIILTNIRSLAKPDRDILDVRSPGKLQEFRALGTYLSSVLFAEGAPLKIVHLPSSIERIIFIQNKDLTKILTSTPVVADMIDDELVYRDASTYEGLYIAGVTDYQDSEQNRGKGSPVNEIDIEGDAMGYDSYKILRNVVLQKNGSGKGNRLSIKMTEVNWTPYLQVEYGESKSNDIDYYWLTDHSTYEPYSHEDSEWENDTLNGRVYTLDENAQKSIITDLSLLQIFLDDYANTEASSINQFTNNVSTEVSNKTYPALSGQLFVANGDAETGISETDLSNIYATAWPNLVIRAEKIEKSFLTKYVEIDPNSGKEIVLDNKAFSDNNTISLAPSSRLKVPTRTHYDFKGFSPNLPGEDNENAVLYVVRNNETNSWALTPEGLAATIDSETKVQTLYAIFVPHPYQISYYYKDGTLIKTLDSPYSNQKGSIVQPSTIPAMDESDLPLDMTYAFLGYSESSDSDDIVDFSTKASNKDAIFYAVFEERSVYSAPTSSDYFEFTVINSGYTDGLLRFPEANVGDSQYNVAGPTCSIKLKPGIVLGGKVTLPAKANVEVNGTVQSLWVTHIANNGFSKTTTQNKITHVFFERNNKYRVIGEKAFAAENTGDAMTNLVWVDYENTDIRAIDQRAFAYCPRLKSYTMPIHAIDIGPGAFSSSFAGEDDVIIRIGSEIVHLGIMAFSNNYCGNNNEIWIGTSSKGAKLDLTYATTTGSNELCRINQRSSIYGFLSAVRFWSSKYESLDKELGSLTINGTIHENVHVIDAFNFGDERPASEYVDFNYVP